MREPITIRFGERSFEIRPLTVRQIIDIEPVSIDMGLGVISGLVGAARIIKIALSVNHPAVAAGLDDLETSGDEMADATKAILELGGFFKTAQGEAMAVSTEPRSGDVSEAA